MNGVPAARVSQQIPLVVRPPVAQPARRPRQGRPIHRRAIPLPQAKNTAHTPILLSRLLEIRNY
jgi:hypothetical protein